MSKRHRDEGATPELDPAMLRDAQHKALTVSLQRYKLSIAELEAQLASSRSTSSTLTDVVSLLGRQLVAVRCAHAPCLLPPPPSTSLPCTALRTSPRPPHSWLPVAHPCPRPAFLALHTLPPPTLHAD